MALTMEYPIITSNLQSGLGAYGTADPWVANASTPFPNGAQNPVGSLYFQPAPAQGGNTTLATAAGYAAGLWMRYVLYKSTANPAVQTGPAPVYYVDETFTTVSGVFSEGIPAATGNASSIAGFMLPNSGTVAGYGLGTTLFTNTILNNGGNGSYVWIGLAGFIPSAYLAAGAQGNPITGASGNWTVAVTTTILRPAAYVIGAVTSQIGDIIGNILPW